MMLLAVKLVTEKRVVALAAMQRRLEFDGAADGSAMLKRSRVRTKRTGTELAASTLLGRDAAAAVGFWK
jgi:hypothetical protein